MFFFKKKNKNKEKGKRVKFGNRRIQRSFNTNKNKNTTKKEQNKKQKTKPVSARWGADFVGDADACSRTCASVTTFAIPNATIIASSSCMHRSTSTEIHWSVCFCLHSSLKWVESHDVVHVLLFSLSVVAAPLGV